MKNIWVCAIQYFKHAPGVLEHILHNQGCLLDLKTLFIVLLNSIFIDVTILS
jgi:hypothetical protein